MGRRLRDEAKKLRWYAQRPELLRVLAGKVRARLDHRVERVRGVHVQAVAWCEANERPLAEVLQSLGVDPAPVPAELRAECQAAMDSTPFRMGGGGHIDLLHALAAGRRNALETGVAYGWSTTALLAGMGEAGRLVSIDLPYAGPDAERWVGAVVPSRLLARWTLLRGADQTLLPAVLDGVTRFDLVHYDSDKSTRGRLWALKLIWGRLSPGALLVSDDIGDNLAFADFADSVQRRPLVVRAGRRRFVGILVR